MDRLPTAAFWLLPSLVGLPILLLAVRRRRRPVRRPPVLVGPRWPAATPRPW